MFVLFFFFSLPKNTLIIRICNIPKKKTQFETVCYLHILLVRIVNIECVEYKICVRMDSLHYI